MTSSKPLELSTGTDEPLNLQYELQKVYPEGRGFKEAAEFADILYGVFRMNRIPYPQVIMYLNGSVADQLAMPTDIVDAVRAKLNDFAANHVVPSFGSTALAETSHQDIDVAVNQDTLSSMSGEQFDTCVQIAMIEAGYHVPGLPQPFAVPTNPHIHVYDIGLPDGTLQLFRWILKGTDGRIGGNGSTYMPDNRIGLKAPTIGIPLHPAPSSGSVSLDRPGIDFHRMMMQLPYSFPHFDDIDYFDKLEQIFRHMRRSALHVPHAQIFNVSPNHVANLKQLFIEFNLRRDLTQDNQVLESKIRLLCRELLAMKFAWDQDEFNQNTVLNEDYGWEFSTLVHGLASFARKGASQPKENAEEISRMSNDEFACYLLGAEKS